MRIYPNHSISILKENGFTIISIQNIANTIGKTLSDISKSDSYSEPFQSYKQNSEHSNINYESHLSINYNYPFTETELNNTLKQCNLSATGFDGITYPMIKHLSQNSFKNLLNLYNRIWIEYVFPTAWHDAIVIPFPKPGKDATDPNNYRPMPSQVVSAKLKKK